jgi:glutathione S-transferase
MKPVLYSGSRAASSWALRAWLALRLAGVEFEEIMLDIRKPQRFANLAKVSEFSPSASVPCLVADSHIVFDSLAICELANDLSGGTLLPADPWIRAEARAFASWQHAGLSQICSRISFESAFYPSKRRLTSSEQVEAMRLFRAAEKMLKRYGGPYLFGALSIADIMLVPTAIRLKCHSPDLGDWPQTSDWLDRLVALDPVKEWLGQAAEEPHIWFEDYLVSSPDELDRKQLTAAEVPASISR